MKYFAGIGSRRTPVDILDLMPKITEYLYSKGYILRSGGADGADTYFEKGVPHAARRDIFLPWKNFNNNSSPHYLGGKNITEENQKIAEEIAKQFHPSYRYLKQGVQKLMIRNTFQILGSNPSDPSQWSSLVVAYAPLDSNGKPKGGTAQALRIASDRDIRIINLAVEEDLNKVKEKLNKDS